MTEAQSGPDELPSKFAYGSDHVDGYSCPAIMAGVPEGDTHLVPYGSVTKQYDKILARRRDATTDVVTEDEAKDAWLETIKNLEATDNSSVAEAREIAEELGWLDDD